MFKLVLEKAEEPEIKLPTSNGSSKKQESSRKTSIIDYAKAFDCVDHNKLWKILKEMGIPDHLTCFLRKLFAGQEETVRTGHGTTDWFQIGKGIHQGWAHHFMANRWRNNEKIERLILLGSKRLLMVTKAIKLKDACSLEEKL